MFILLKSRFKDLLSLNYVKLSISKFSVVSLKIFVTTLKYVFVCYSFLLHLWLCHDRKSSWNIDTFCYSAKKSSLTSIAAWVLRVIVVKLKEHNTWLNRCVRELNHSQAAKSSCTRSADIVLYYYWLLDYRI